MKKTLIITAAATLSLSISSVVFALDIETAQRYSAPLTQVEMGVTAVESGVDTFVQTEIRQDLMSGSNVEVQELGGSVQTGGGCRGFYCGFGSNAEVQ